MKKSWLLLALLFLADPQLMTYPQGIPSPEANLNNVRYAKSFAGATADAKIAACLADLAPTGGTCHTDGVTGAFAAPLVITQPDLHLALGAGTISPAGAFTPIVVAADNVTITGLGPGITTIYQPNLYRQGINVPHGAATVPAPKNFTMTGISLVGPNPIYRGTLNTTVSGSAYTATWVSGPTNFSGLVAGMYIMIGPNLTPYQIATVSSSATSLTLTTSPGNQTGVAYRAHPYSGNVSISGKTVTLLSGKSFSGLSQNLNGGINFGGRGSYVDADGRGNLLKIQSVNSNSSLTLANNPGSGFLTTSGADVAWVSGTKFGALTAGQGITINSIGYTIQSVTDKQHLVLTASAGSQTNVEYSPDYTSIPYFISWDANGTVGVGCSGCTSPHIFNNEFTGWSHCAVGLGEAYSSSGAYAAATHAIVAGNNFHDNPGEGVTIFVSNSNPALVEGFNLVTNNQMNYNGLSCWDTNGRFDTFSYSECSYNGWANKNGDTSNFQVHNSDNTVDTVTADFGNQWDVGVDGSNQTLMNIHACGATSAFGPGYGIGIQLGNSGFKSSRITLKGGVVCNNPSHGIALARMDQGLVEGFHVYGNGGNGIILYYNPSAPNTNNSVTENIVSGNTSGAVADSGSNNTMNCNGAELSAPCNTNAIVFPISQAAPSGTAPACISTGFSSTSTNCTVTPGGNGNLLNLSSLADGTGATTGTYVITFHNPLGAHYALCLPVAEGTSWNGRAAFHSAGASTTFVTINWDNNGVVPVKGSYYGVNVGCWGT